MRVREPFNYTNMEEKDYMSHLEDTVRGMSNTLKDVSDTLVLISEKRREETERFLKEIDAAIAVSKSIHLKMTGGML